MHHISKEFRDRVEAKRKSTVEREETEM